MRNKNARVGDPNSFITCPGDRYRIEYAPIISGDGSLELVESGKIDIQEYIQSFKDQTDMSFIISRLMMGDTSVLNQKEPMYGDFSQMPKTYAEALQLVIDKEAEFMKLPVEVRNQFDHDYRKWMSQSGTDEWFQKMKAVSSSEEKSITEPSEGSQEVKNES